MAMIEPQSLFELIQEHARRCSRHRCFVRDQRLVTFFNEPMTKIVATPFVFVDPPRSPPPPGPNHHGISVSFTRGTTEHGYFFAEQYIKTFSSQFQINIMASCQCESPGMHLSLMEAACTEYNKI